MKKRQLKKIEKRQKQHIAAILDKLTELVRSKQNGNKV
jgi:hypothetical protein